jgi:hypothetical protein
MTGRRGIIGRALGAAAFLSTLVAAAPAPIDADRVAAKRFGNDADWYRDRIPLFESSDAMLDAVYYYRWQIVRAHQRDLGERGFISTEFLDDVGWQLEPWASLNDATVFHVNETRWLRDRRYAADYIDHMFTGGNDRHFSDSFADWVWSRYLVDGDRTEALRHLTVMRHLYGQWNDHLDIAKGVYWIEPLLDATEYTIASIDASGAKDGFTGGNAFRPSINAYMFANARALSRLTALAGEEPASADYAAKAAAIKARVQADLWNPKLGHFTDRYKANNEHVHYWDFIRGRELVGFVPWTYDLPDDDPKYAAAWRHLLDAKGFAGAAGMRTVEPSYEHYMRQYRYEGSARECQWNGPVWPFQTTQVLAGMANLLDHYDQSVVTRADYLRLLRQYARLHYQGDRLDLEEDYDPETGRPIVGLKRSHHYFHSGFIDLVMTGVVGIRPRADDVLEVNPLIPATGRDTLKWFRAANVPYHGHLVTVTWDADGSHFGGGAGLRVEAEGREIARSTTLKRIGVALTRLAAPTIVRPVNRAVQLVRGEFPRASASSNTDAEALHDAIDGRTWFFPEAPNGWQSTGPEREQWYAVNFGREVALSSAELAFAQSESIAAPQGIKMQRWTGSAWADLGNATVVLNGITRLSWAPVRTSRVRVVMQRRAGDRPIRLVEFKAF